MTERLAGEIDGAPDPWAARDAYVDVVIGASDAGDFGARCGPRGDADARATFVALMEIQRWRLAMFASDGWYWDDPMRPETANVLRAAARAARSIDAVAGTTLERRLVDDLGLFTSPGHGFDGAEIYRRALAEVGQPTLGHLKVATDDEGPVRARGLRAAGWNGREMFEENAQWMPTGYIGPRGSTEPSRLSTPYRLESAATMRMKAMMTNPIIRDTYLCYSGLVQVGRYIGLV